MSARWFAPAFALAVLVGLADRLPAADGDYQFEFSTDPAKVVGKPTDLDVRPNTSQPFYLFVRNKSGDFRTVRVQVIAADQLTVLAEVKLPRVAQDKPDAPNVVRVPLAKPPMPAGAAPAPAPMPATTAGGQAPMPMAPPAPPGIELKPTGDATRRQFIFYLRAFDERDNDKPIQKDVSVVVGIRQPTDYIKRDTITYAKKGTTNTLTVVMKPTDDFAGSESCPVDLVLPPQRVVNVAALREGVFRQPVATPKDTARLYAKDMPLRGNATDQGIFYINVDNVPRAYVYRHALNADTEKDAPITDLLPAAIWFMESDKIALPESLATRPRVVPLRVEPSTTLTDASIEVTVRREEGDEKVATISRDSTRERRAWLEAPSAEGGVLVTTRMSDWVVPLDLRDLRGRFTLRADLVNNKHESLANFRVPLVVDDTKPDKVSVEALPGRDPKVDPPRHLRTKPLPVRVTASDPESGISRVVVFFGKVAPDGKLPEPVAEATYSRETGYWVAEVPVPAPPPATAPPAPPGTPIIPPPPRVVDLTAIAVNGVGIPSEPVSQRIQLIEPPVGGTIKGTVAMSKYGKPLPGVAVLLIAAEDRKAKGATRTNDKGEYIFENVPPGGYLVVAGKPDSGVGTKGEEAVRIVAGKVDPEIVNIILARKP